VNQHHNQAASQTAMPIAKLLASFAVEAQPPEAALAVSRRLLFDVTGLAVAARDTDYVAAALASAVDEGPCTALGHSRRLTMYDAALVNGTAAHGEDYDDTFEGGPIHAGAVIVPAVLAAAGAPKIAVGLPADAIARAFGIAGSLASGIIEYLADGSSTKRLHAGAAAQAGLRAAHLAQAGFAGPITVFEGSHGLYKAFAPSKTPDFSKLLDGLGQRWVMETLAFKPYACGTMTQPFVDCALRLAAAGIKAEEIVAITCKVGEGTVHRLWEPLIEKHSPPNGYAGKFSTPYCMAVAFIDGEAGLGQFTDNRANDPALRKLAAKMAYVIDPDDEYPRNFSGHLKAELADGTMREFTQPHMRGGAREPLDDAELDSKLEANLRFGGLDAPTIAALRAALAAIADGGPTDLGAARV
jgi:2-methylcitrate dehydratase PrpD